jgi:hypothetical protein
LSSGLLIGSPRSFSFIGGVAKKQKVKLGHLILLSALHTNLARLEMMLSFSYFFFCSSKSVDQSQEDLAKSGYKTNKEVKKM